MDAGRLTGIRKQDRIQSEIHEVHEGPYIGVKLPFWGTFLKKLGSHIGSVKTLTPLRWQNLESASVNIAMKKPNGHKGKVKGEGFIVLIQST